MKTPPGGSEWVISVGDYVECRYVIHSLLWGVATIGKLAQALARFLCFSFLICSSPFCFLLTVFHDTFSMYYKILSSYVY